jgi:hypothetical protein
MSDIIINKVAESGLITIDLEDYYPKGVLTVYDLKEHLYMGLILKEKDFRESLKSRDWEPYRDKFVAITCTTDAIIPRWASMLVASYLEPVAKDLVFGDEKAMLSSILIKNLGSLRAEDYAGKRVVIKGCGEIEIPEAAYVEITRKLRPFAKSIMYGEACSTVPIYKQGK